MTDTTTLSGAPPQSREPARNARVELLKATSELMNSRDTLEISLSEISAQAGVNSALVKYHFGNKRGLLIALIERDVGNSMAQLEELVDSDNTATEKMRMHIVGIMNLYYRYRYLNNLVAALLRDSTPEEANDLSDRLIKPAADAQRKILEQGWATGEFRPVDPLVFYFTLTGACDIFFSSEFALKMVFDREGIDDGLRKRLIENTSAVLLGGIVNK